MVISLQVWIAAVKATVSFVVQIEDPSVRAHFVDVLPLLVAVSHPSIVNDTSLSSEEKSVVY